MLGSRDRDTYNLFIARDKMSLCIQGEAAIRVQITETLEQFPTVDSVIISIDGRTEDILQP